MHKLFITIHFFVTRNKILSLLLALVFLGLCGFFASKIRFEEDITKLIPKNKKSEEATRVLNQLNFSDKITVIINAEGDTAPAGLAGAATVFLDSLQQCKKYVSSIQGKVDDENIQEAISFVNNNLPLFLDDADYTKLQQQLNKDSIANTVQANFRSIISPSGLVTKDFILRDPFGISFTGLKKLQQLGVGGDFELQDGFVVTKDGKRLLLFINTVYPGSETEKNTVFVNKLNQIKDHLNSQYSGTANVEYFGSAVIAVANATQIKSDVHVTITITMTLLVLIFMFYYKKIYVPIIVFLPTAFGVLFSIAFLYFLRGTISAISLGIGSILVGVTIDYSLHILTHFKHNSDVRALYKDIAKPLIMSSSTTAIAFLCLLFVNSDALKDLGIFAAGSVIVTSVFALLLMPHLYKPTEKKKKSKKGHTVLDRVAAFSFHKSKPLIGFSIILIVVSLFTFRNVVFDNDLSQLNYVPDDVKHAEKHLEESTSLASKSLYIASYGNSAEEVMSNNTRLAHELAKDKAAGKLLQYSSIGGIVLSQQDQQSKINRWNTFWTPQRKQKVKSALINEGAKLGFKQNAYQLFYDTFDKEFHTISIDDYMAVKTLYLDEFISKKDGFYTIASIVRVSGTQRDGIVKELSASPKTMVIDRQQLNETFLGGLKTDFNTLVNYSFIAVLLILFVFFRRIELVLVSCIPIIITGIVTTGIMSIFGIRLNIFSSIVCTLILGYGVDFSIFMTSALQKEYTFGRKEMASYRTSIILAVLTTVLGIGALIFAGHPALKSISSVSLIGIFSAVAITFIFYPLIFRFFLTKRTKKGKAPLELRTMLHSILSFIYYGLGGFLLSVFSLVFINILPVKRKRKMQAFRYAMSKFMKSVLYTNPFVKKRVINPHNEKFEKPAVIIANHSSFLDILAIGMLSPKIIYLVSDWVYNSPVFGIGVKLAGFYPVSKGLEGGVEHLREKVAQGYSLVIFPEGTRSVSNHINRFHKGAFYLAQEFGLDIIPVVIHGNSEVLPKGDFILNDGSITLKILPRITPQDETFGKGYTERTKKTGTYFKEQFRLMRREIEGPEYFKRMILYSFAYKDPEIVQAVKQGLHKNLDVYYRLNPFIEPKGSVLHIADDYGETAVLLALQEPQRKIYTYIADPDKYDVAKTSYINKKRDIYYLSHPQDMQAVHCTTIVVAYEKGIELLKELPEKAEKLILVTTNNAAMPYEGFTTEHREEGFMVLRRKERG
ncbi:1-acyl-sn-glycerol-3-phosphate acyltransferase [Flavobacterium rhizosphaerae]|uniref:1-acyl-sn-glycerol-3-phosphate acyltransferase n=1 Tax=Flavobacterium rhizosphaerae TaxID=3163298 RepID=A0ABW8YXH6_9FLAO